MSVREDLHRLADELPEEAAAEALAYMRFLLALETAPEDDEPETPAERAAVAEAEEDMRAGRLVSHDEIRREFLGPH